MIYPSNNEWREALHEEFEKPYYAELCSVLEKEEENGHIVYPCKKDIFKALDLCSPSQTKVVILGQDPYHGEGEAMGLSFSVPDGIKAPPSLKNIFKEIENDLNVKWSGHTNLEPWARQGVLLLNAILTVRKDCAASHRGIGWEQFTDAIISVLNEKENGIVFMLWGNYAKSKAPLIDASKHLILEAAHPSPLARGAYFGSRHFSKANYYLESIGKEPIKWVL